MNFLLVALLIPLYFTAPSDTVGPDAAGRLRPSPDPVCAYIFHRLDSSGTITEIPGYADSAGLVILRPHEPGTRETVWLSPGANATGVTIYVLSRDANGNLSPPSNGCIIGHSGAPTGLAVRGVSGTALDVPIVTQERERCGQAALAMVLRYYGADSTALREADGAYDRALRGSLITDLAGAARRAGFDAAVQTLTPESVIDLLDEGVPPILLYQNGSGPMTVRHFGVVTGWDGSRATFTLHDGSARPLVVRRGDLAKRWETAGAQALVVRPRVR